MGLLLARRTYLSALAVLVMAAVSVPARADVITSFTGNTQPAYLPLGSGAGATIDFAVYNTTGGSAGDTFHTGLAGFDALFAAGTGSGAFDTGAKYLYLYETVNNGPAAASFPISQNTVSTIRTALTSFGSFSGAAFSSTVLGSPAGFTTTSPAVVGVTPTILGGQAGLGTPMLLLGSSSLKALYTTELASGQKSVIFGYTSNLAPSFVPTSVQDGGTSGVGTAVGVVPEPSPLLLSLLGLPAGAAFLRRKAKKVSA